MLWTRTTYMSTRSVRLLPSIFLFSRTVMSFTPFSTSRSGKMGHQTRAKLHSSLECCLFVELRPSLDCCLFVASLPPSKKITQKRKDMKTDWNDWILEILEKERRYDSMATFVVNHPKKKNRAFHIFLSSSVISICEASNLRWRKKEGPISYARRQSRVNNAKIWFQRLSTRGAIGYKSSWDYQTDFYGGKGKKIYMFNHKIDIDPVPSSAELKDIHSHERSQWHHWQIFHHEAQNRLSLKFNKHQNVIQFLLSIRDG